MRYQTYVYSVVYMASHDPSKYRFSTPTYALMFTVLISAYCVYVVFPLLSISSLLFSLFVSCPLPLFRSFLFPPFLFLEAPQCR